MRISGINHDGDRASRQEPGVHTQKVLGHCGAIDDEGSETGRFAAKGLIRTPGCLSNRPPAQGLGAAAAVPALEPVLCRHVMMDHRRWPPGAAHGRAGVLRLVEAG